MLLKLQLVPKKNNFFLTTIITLFLSSIICPTIASSIKDDNSEIIVYFDIEGESQEGELFNDLEVKFLEYDKQGSFSITKLIAKKNIYYFNLNLIVTPCKDIFLLPPKLF